MTGTSNPLLRQSHVLFTKYFHTWIKHFNIDRNVCYARHMNNYREK